MPNQLTELLTQENITLALSIFGSVGALVTFISSYLSKRKNLKINITSSTYKKIMRKLILMITFENRFQPSHCSNFDFYYFTQHKD